MPVGYPQDIVTNIINVHWASGLTAVLSDTYNVVLLKIDGQDATWENLGTLDFWKHEGDSWTGSPQACAFAEITDPVTHATTPTFVLVGGGGTTSAIGLIMSSSEGRNWTRRFSFSEPSDTFTGATIMAVAWNDTDKAFYAAGHQSDNGVDPDPDNPGIFSLRETDLLFKSTDGKSWSEVGRNVREWRSTADPPDYSVGLLVAHLDDLGVYDNENGNRAPDGIYGYDEDAQVIIAPVPVYSVLYDVGGLSSPTPTGVTITSLGPGPAPDYPTDTGFPPRAVGFESEWVAVGGSYASHTQKAALLTLTLDDDGEPVYDWEDISPSPPYEAPDSNGINPFIFICCASIADAGL